MSLLNKFGGPNDGQYYEKDREAANAVADEMIARWRNTFSRALYDLVFGKGAFDGKRDYRDPRERKSRKRL